MIRLLVTMLLMLVVMACTEKAPPMQGECTEIDVDDYEGHWKLGPTLRCVWRSRSWDCVESYSEWFKNSRWSCHATGPAPAEAP